MPFRQLPATDATRTQAINAAVKKKATTTGAALLVSPETATALDALAPKWVKETTERAAALGAQTSATSSLNLHAATLRTVVSHFFQVYQLGVARGVFSPSGRALYELSVNEETLPETTTEADLLLWAGRIVTGDPLRVVQFSEPAMALPSAVEVSTALAAYNSQLAIQSGTKDSLATEQADVTALRTEADQVITDVWDEVEFSLRKLDAPALRRRAREWGVLYALRPGEPEETTADPTPPA